MSHRYQPVEEVAKELGIGLGALITLIALYLVDDPQTVSIALRSALRRADEEDIDEALEAIKDDYNRDRSI